MFSILFYSRRVPEALQPCVFLNSDFPLGVANGNLYRKKMGRKEENQTWCVFPGRSWAGCASTEGLSFLPSPPYSQVWQLLLPPHPVCLPSACLFAGSFTSRAQVLRLCHPILLHSLLLLHFGCCRPLCVQSSPPGPSRRPSPRAVPSSRWPSLQLFTCCPCQPLGPRVRTEISGSIGAIPRVPMLLWSPAPGWKCLTSPQPLWQPLLARVS